MADHDDKSAGPGMDGGSVIIVARSIVNHGKITAGTINGEPTFTMSAKEARALGSFLMAGHRERMSDEDEASWGLLTGRLHRFLVGLQEKDKTDG